MDLGDLWKLTERDNVCMFPIIYFLKNGFILASCGRVFVCVVEMHCFVQLWPWLLIDVVMQGKVKISRGFTLIHVLLTTALPPLCLPQSGPIQKVICSLISNQRCMHPIYTVSFVMHLKCADHRVALVLIKWPPSVNVDFSPVKYFTG